MHFNFFFGHKINYLRKYSAGQNEQKGKKMRKKNLRGEKPADKRISQKTTLTFQSSGIETIDAKRRRHSIFPRSKHFHIVDKITEKIPFSLYIYPPKNTMFKNHRKSLIENSVPHLHFAWTKIDQNYPKQCY